MRECDQIVFIEDKEAVTQLNNILLFPEDIEIKYIYYHLLFHTGSRRPIYYNCMSIVLELKVGLFEYSYIIIVVYSGFLTLSSSKSGVFSIFWPVFGVFGPPGPKIVIFCPFRPSRADFAPPRPPNWTPQKDPP